MCRQARESGPVFLLYVGAYALLLCAHNDRVGATLAVALGVSKTERLDGSAQFRQVEGDREGRPYVRGMGYVR